MDLAEILYESMSKKIGKIEPDGVYALSFFVYNDWDDPAWPTVTLGFNTDKQVEKAMAGGGTDSLAEAKWNYAFWLQNKLFEFGASDEDKEIIAEWKKIKNITFKNEDEEDDSITLAFVEELIKVSQRLHCENVIKKVFGKSIPIIIHELEYYDTIFEQTERANPAGVASEFLKGF